MNKLLFIICCLICLAPIKRVSAQDDKKFEYHRSSLYSFVIVDPRTLFADDIAAVFKQTPLSDKFNDHNLTRKVIDSRYCLWGKKSKELDSSMKRFVNDFKLGNKMIEKWFNMDKTTGNSNMKLVAERGFYDASALDVKLADLTVRGRKMLEDAGEDLIGQTFVVANYIRYNDRSKAAGVFYDIASLIGSIAGLFAGGDNLVKTSADLVSTTTENWDGFKVVVETYLFKLDWNEENSALFYKKYYQTDGKYGYANFKAFENDTLFKLKYIGKTQVASGKTAVFGTEDRISFMRRVCARSVDKSIVQLQHQYEDFRVKTPIVSVDPITAYIGMKEGVTPKTKFEILEFVEDENGHTDYKHVGIVKAKKGNVWDNRYGAEVEGSRESKLGCTTFTKIIGGSIYPGMLLREIK